MTKLLQFFQTTEGFLSIRRLGFFILLIYGLVNKEILFINSLFSSPPIDYCSIDMIKKAPVFNFAELDASCNKVLDYAMAALGFAAIDPVVNMFKKKDK